MNDEQMLVVALSLTSTFAAGLAVERVDAPAAIGRRRMATLVLASGIVLPLFAFALDRWLALGVAGLGLVIASASPGGSTGPLLAVVGRGDATTATRMFVASTLFGTLTAIAVLVMRDAFAFDLIARASVIVVACSIAPLGSGLALRRWRPSWARVLGPASARLGIVLLVTTVVLLCVRHLESADALDLVVAAVLVLVSLVPALFVRGRAQRIAVAQVSAVHNIALAMLVLAALGVPGRATIAVLAYGLVMYVAAAVLVVVERTRSRAEARA